MGFSVTEVRLMSFIIDKLERKCGMFELSFSHLFLQKKEGDDPESPQVRVITTRVEFNNLVMAEIYSWDELRHRIVHSEICDVMVNQFGEGRPLQDVDLGIEEVDKKISEMVWAFIRRVTQAVQP